MATRLQYHRSLLIRVGDVVLTDFDSSRPGPLRNRGLDGSSSVTLLSGPEPQPSTTTVYGLAADRIEAIAQVMREARERAFLARQVLRVGRIQVAAGRPGFASVIADHEIVDLETGLVGADRFITIQARDGRLAWADSFVTSTTSPYFDPTDAARALAHQLGIETQTGAATTSTTRPDLAGGFTGFAGGADRGLFGASAGANQRLLSSLGIRPVYVRGAVRWVRPDLADLVPAVELVEDATLLWLDPPGELGVRKARALFDPLFEPGRQVFLRARTGKTLTPTPYRVDSVVHEVSTSEDQNWTSSLVLRPSLPSG